MPYYLQYGLYIDGVLWTSMAIIVNLHVINISRFTISTVLLQTMISLVGGIEELKVKKYFKRFSQTCIKMCTAL